MNRTLARLHPRATFVAALGLLLATACLTAADTGAAAAASRSGGNPIVTIDGGAVRGIAVAGSYAFRGLPYAAPPTGKLRWRAPRPPAAWHGVRDATEFAPSCPQPPNLFLPPGRLDEDCLYLNVSTPTLRHGAERPVL